MQVKERTEARPATWVEREPELKACAYSHVDVITPDDLTGDDVGALDPGELGFIAHCHCGWTTEIRYSQIAAQSAVCKHVVNANGTV